VYLAAFLLWNGLTGTLDAWRRTDGSWNSLQLFLESVNAVLVGYAFAACAVARRGALGDLHRLRPVLDCSDAAFENIGRRVVAPGAWLPVAALALAVAVALLMVNLDPAIWDDRPRPRFPDPLYLWVWFRNFAVGWVGFRLGLAEFAVMRGFARLGAEHVRVDLLDLGPLEPFVRKGQRSVVIWIVYSSIFSLFWVAGSAATANPFLLVVVLGLATAALLWPLTGVRRRIMAAKRAELGRVNREIRQESAALLAGEGSAEPPRLTGLIAYRRLVEDVREWPLTAPALLRFGLFVLVGLGSWLGAALVERALEAALR
jgi:hypothetical protein